ncbi:PAS domain S-box protein [Sporomusa sp.]|uniref:PAS domain S-box protein n=1 Tax=Sporomusa sp. TaxID=2078658 RepID=UPI002D1BE5B1|nr:PAS domain S-box protein [Sporomusa sp.]HWR42395.1 PAS domain S-box protein [Sporomusa sp.]
MSNDIPNSCLLDELAAMRQEMQALVELHQSNLRVSTAFTASPIPMAVATFPEGRILDVNDSFAAFIGYSRQEIIGFTDLELNLWERLAERNAVIDSINRQYKVRNAEVRIRKRPDEIRITLFSGECVTQASKNYLLVWCVDITELKQTQEALWQQKQEFETLAENSPDVIARFDKNLRHMYINPVIEVITGMPAADFIGRTQAEMGFDNQFCDLWRSHTCRVFKTGKKSLFEGQFSGVQGRKYYYQAHLAPEYALDGSVEYVLCSIRDITTLNETEQALRLSEERKQRILAAFPDLLFLINKSGVFLDYQAATGTLPYTSPENFIGKTVSEVLPAETSKKVMYYVDRALATGETQFFDYQLTLNESLFTFEARVVWATGNEVLFIVRDVTELKQLQSELVRLDRLNIVGEMAAGIAHELRNPMTTVRGFLQILSNKPESNCFKEHFTLMIEELDRANSIITEYLSLAKNKAVHLEPHNLTAIVKALAPLILADAAIAGKNLHLVLTDTPDLLIDAKEIRQLLLNLTRNGLEAMQPGTTLTIKTYLDNGEVFLVVRDQGPGIQEELLEKIGTPFFTTKDFGTGLGLAICYSIAARHNAVISLDTSPAGTAIYVRFKVQ